MTELVTVRMFLAGETAGAVKVADKEALPTDGTPLFYHWLPRKVITSFRTETTEPGKFPRYEFTLPDWKCEQLNLWNFVRKP